MKNTRMFRKGTSVLFCFIFPVIANILFVEGSAAQAPVAGFTSNVTSGCSPLVVQFTDQSTNNPTSWLWDLGNGSTSTIQNPTSTYINPGSYTVTLTATNASGSSTTNITITVINGPVANFTSTDTAGCTPHTVTFTDQSTTSSGTITQWEWNFGDGNTSTQQNPVHTYTMAGTFNVFLKVTNNSGCTNTIFKQQYIRAGAGAAADFISNVPNYCQVPVTVTFSNNSQAEPGATYLWEFGDGTTSTDINPAHTYTAFGNYTVKLTVQNTDGCNSIRQQNVNLTGKDVTFTGPSTICVGSAATFQMTSSPAPLSQTWDMGDGTTYSTANVTHTFNSPATYNVTLTNEFAGGCIATRSQTVTVQAGPPVDFIADTTKACKPPFTVKFQSQGTAGSYLWLFGDGDSSAIANPTHTYQSAGNFTVTLIASNGCTSNVEKAAFVNIQPPTVAISNLPVNDGCTPYTFAPVADVNAVDGIASYFWDFGNGYTSTDPEPGYTYTTPGNYTIKLRIQTNGGCIDSVIYTDGVKVGAGVQLDFSANPLTTCVDQPVTFTFTSSATPTAIEWDFGDGETSTEASPSHSYKHTGKYNVTLTIRYGNCVSKLTKADYIEVLPPEAKFTPVRDCNNKRMINFRNESVGAVSAIWNFGDGNTSFQLTPSHIYAADGNYIVSLTVTNGGCTHTFTDTIEVSSASIDFISSATVVCRGTEFLLKALVPNTVDAVSYEWNVSSSGVQTVNVDSIIWILYQPGSNNVALKITTSNGCTETISKSNYITAYGPTADFTSDNAGGCINTSVNFADNSVTDGTHTINQWSWDFGDGSTDGGTNVSHTYTQTGKYEVSLKVTDSYGCSDTRSKANFISISNGKAGFESVDSMSCIGRNVIFRDTSSGTISNWEWRFGDGSAITGVQNPAHSYADSGSYSVTLKITETSGCTDSITKINYVTIKNPKAKFGLSDTFSTCPPLSVSFWDSSYYAEKWSWDFDDGGSSPIPSPINLYNIPKTYNVKLTVTSPGGCTDSAFAKIRILGPYGDFNYTPVIGCTPLPVNYSVTSTEAVKFMWDYSDGIVDSGMVANSAHIYLSGGKFVPKVILTDASGCRVPVVGEDTIYIEKTMLDFSASQLAFCDSGTVIFTNRSTVIAPSAQYEWNYGNGSNTTDSSFNYTTPGTYDVTLIATSTMGCRDTLIKPAYIRIHQSPVAAIISEDSLCMLEAFTFTAQLQPDTSGIRQWNWMFGNGQISSQQYPPQQIFTPDGSYSNSLFIEDNEGCTTTVSKNVVVHPLPIMQALQDTLICRGDSIQLFVTGAADYSWLAPNNGLSCTNCQNPVASPQFDIMYKVEGRSAFGCKAYDSVTVKVFQPYVVSVDPPADSICEGRSIRLTAFGAPLYTWSPAAGLSATNIANPIASPDTTRTYKLTGYDNLGCFKDSIDVTIKVLQNPEVNAGPDLVLSAGSTVQLQATGAVNGESYDWSPSVGLSCTSCPNPVVTAGDNITYTVRVRNASGCTAQDQVKISVTCNEGNLFVPNTFTPNGDGMNDVFYIRGNGLYAVRSLRIFNRWGEMVFERKNLTANDPSAGWNGTFKGAIASSDTYVYQLEVMCTNSQVLKYNGTISLIR